MASQTINSPQQEIDLAYLLQRLWSAKVGVALFVLVITGLVYVFTQISDPKYRSEAQLLIETQETAFTRPEVEDGQQVATIDERDIASEIQVMRSRDVGMAVIERLSLGELAQFDPAREGISPLKSLLILFGLSPDPLSLSAGERVFQNYDDGLSVFNIPGSRVVVVAYESTDPELSARIANTLIDIYQASKRAAQATNTRSASSFLETEIAGLRQQVAQAEAAVARYRSGAGLFVGPNETSLSAQRLSELSTELTRARADQSNASSRARELRGLIAAQGTQVALPDSFSTPLTQRLAEEQATLRARIAELSATLLPAHPRILELNAQLADLGGQLRAEAGRVAQRFENEAQVALGRADSLEDQLAGLRAEASRTAEAEVELRALEREAAAQRDLLASYLVRFREAATREDTALLPTNARVIQTAQIERNAIFPQTLPMVMIALAGSLAMALLGVISHAILSGAVRDDGQHFVDRAHAHNAEPIRREPVAAAEPAPARPPLPEVQTVPVQPVPVQPIPRPAAPSPVAPSPAMLSPSMLTQGNFPGIPDPPSYVLTDPSDCRRLFAHLRRISTPGGEGLRVTMGASDASVNAGEVGLRLARAMAHSGRSVVFVDCVGDLAGGGLGADGPGFYELVTGAAGFDAALHRDMHTPLHIVPSGFALADRSMIADDAADLVFSALAGSYESVIVNAGRDPQLLLECARINDCMVLGGQGARIASLANTLSSIVARDRLIAVQMASSPANGLSQAARAG